MFCPKCGLQNADDTKFCRGCGVELSFVLAALDGKRPSNLDLRQKYIGHYSRSIRLLLLCSGFVLLSVWLRIYGAGNPLLWIYMLAPAIFFGSAGISRFFQARAVKALIPRDDQSALRPAQTEFLKPPRSIYSTDDLIAQPLSITDRTTRHLEMEPGPETTSLPIK